MQRFAVNLIGSHNCAITSNAQIDCASHYKSNPILRVAGFNFEMYYSLVVSYRIIIETARYNSY